MKEGFRFHWHFLLGSLKKFTHKTTWFVFGYELGFWVLFLVLGTGLSGYFSKSFTGFYPNAVSPAQLANLQGPFTTGISALYYLYLTVIILVLIGFLLVYHHFTSTMYFLFTKHGSFLSVLQAYPISFSLVGKAWIPSVYLILAGLLVSIISLVFNIFPEALKSYPTFIIYVLLLTFARVYYRDLLTHWKV